MKNNDTNDKKPNSDSRTNAATKMSAPRKMAQAAGKSVAYVLRRVTLITAFDHVTTTARDSFRRIGELCRRREKKHFDDFDAMVFHKALGNRDIVRAVFYLRKKAVLFFYAAVIVLLISLYFMVAGHFTGLFFVPFASAFYAISLKSAVLSKACETKNLDLTLLEFLKEEGFCWWVIDRGKAAE